MTPLEFALWVGLGVHNKQYDDQFTNSDHSAIAQACVQNDTLAACLDHRSIIDKVDTGETWIDIKLRIW